MSNVYWKEFIKSEDKNRFLLNLAEDMQKIFDAKDVTQLTDEDFHYPELINPITFDEKEGILILENGNELCYEDTLICYQDILDGPTMLLIEESLERFFDGLFNKTVDNFTNEVEKELTTHTFEGITSTCYAETREDGVYFSGILFK